VCVATEIDFIFWGGGVVVVGPGGFFAVFVGCVVGVVGGCCLSLLLFGVVLGCVSFARYPSPVLTFCNIKLSVYKWL